MANNFLIFKAPRHSSFPLKRRSVFSSQYSFWFIHTLKWWLWREYCDAKLPPACSQRCNPAIRPFVQKKQIPEKTHMFWRSGISNEILWNISISSTWWLNQPTCKIFVKLDDETPGIRGENNKVFELPPPSHGFFVVLHSFHWEYHAHLHSFH